MSVAACVVVPSDLVEKITLPWVDPLKKQPGFGGYLNHWGWTKPAFGGFELQWTLWPSGFTKAQRPPAVLLDGEVSALATGCWSC